MNSCASGFAGSPDLDSLIGSSGGLKDGGSVQSRFKWMMDGSSLTPSPPEPTLHNGEFDLILLMLQTGMDSK